MITKFSKEKGIMNLIDTVPINRAATILTRTVQTM